MELNAKQQIVELIKDSRRILLCTHARPDGDALGSLLALHLALKKAGKEIISLVPDNPANVFKFLPSLSEVKYDFTNAKDFIISINTTEVKIDRLGYKNYPESSKLEITISPSSGNISADHISFRQGGSKFDLIIALDCTDLERLAKIYDQNTDLFYETPVANIDHHAGNDHFGKMNWVDLTATSTAEILVALLESLGREKSLFDADIATCLLTGIITDTGSFQNTNTTPKSFTIAAQLIAAGARQQEIIQHVYKTKTLSMLKIWGRILSAVKLEDGHHFVWSSVGMNDFTELGAEEDESAGVVDELLKTTPGIDFALLLAEKSDGIHGNLRSVGKGVNVAEIAKLFGGGGHEAAAGFKIISGTLAAHKDRVISQIKEYQAKKLGLDSSQTISMQDQTLEMPPTVEIPSSNQQKSLSKF